MKRDVTHSKSMRESRFATVGLSTIFVNTSHTSMMTEPSLQDQQTVFDDLSKKSDLLSDRDYVSMVEAKNAIVDAQFTRPPTSDVALATRIANDAYFRLLSQSLEVTHDNTDVPTVRQRAEQLLKDLETEEQVSTFLDVFDGVMLTSSSCSSQALRLSRRTPLSSQVVVVEL